jgi:glycine hydroxymethyltransferase
MVLGGPLPHVMAAKAVALAEARRPEFADYAQQIVANARALAEGLLKRDVRLVTGGTDNHLVLMDVRGFGLTGRQAESALLDAGLVTNRNSVPADPNGAWYTTGVRLGTPALTTRGLREDELSEVGDLIADVLSNTQAEGGSKVKYRVDEQVAQRVRARAAELVGAHPLYPEIDLTPQG